MINIGIKIILNIFPNLEILYVVDPKTNQFYYLL